MARQEDFLFAERALQRGYATEEQVQECLSLLDRLRAEMNLEESLANLMVKKGYLAPAQAHVLEAEIDPNRPDKPKNRIEGYQLLERIGSGAMGSVYKAHHLKLDIPVALKVLNPSLASSKTQIERLKREARLAARLNHPNVVRCLDVGESNGFHYLVMEFVEGKTVRDLMEKGPVGEKEALAIVREVASGLAHAHAQGVVHRDVKPGNIMLTSEGAAKLADFGLARGQEPSDLTLEHASIGTPQYVAPEQMQRGADATARSDLFSLGSTLYHMVTGRPPFDGERLSEIVQNVLACRFPPPESLAPGLSRDTIYVIGRLMRSNPRERYANAGELVADLDRIERQEPIAPPDFLGDYQAFLRKRRSRRNAILAGCAAVLVGVGALLFVLDRNEKERVRRMESCRVADGTRSEVASLSTVPDLRDAVLAMEKAEAAATDAGCPADTLRNLPARLKTTREALTALMKAEEVAGHAVEANANYRDAESKLAVLKPALPGVAARIEELSADVRRRSDEAAWSRYTRQLTSGFLDFATMTREARAFAADLETRYLPIDAPWVGVVAQAPRLLDDLQKEWQRLEERRQDFDKELEGGQYSRAAQILATLQRDEAQATKEIRASGYLKNFSNLFPGSSERADKLFRAETHEWHDVILPAFREQMDALDPRPDKAEDLVQGFLQRASEQTERDVSARLGEAKSKREELRAQQSTMLATDEALCLTLMRGRRYAAAYERVAAAAQSDKWLPEIAEQYRLLSDRAETTAGIPDRFLERVRREKKVTILDFEVAGGQIERAPGDDKDLFVARLGKVTREFTLADLERKTLEGILAFDSARQRAWFYAAEAYREDAANHPYDAQTLRESALQLGLGEGDPWTAAVVADLARTQQRIQEGEARAKQAQAEFAALKQTDNVKALALVRELLGPLAWTHACGPSLDLYVKLKKDLERTASPGLLQQDVGVPSDQLDYGGQEKPTTITFTGRKWNPDEARIAKDAQDRDAQLDKATTEFWTGVFRSQGRLADEIPGLVARARSQLLFWSALVETGDGGGYRPVEAAIVTPEKWWKPDFRPPEIALNFPFRADRPWKIQFEVRWPTDEPGYFVVAAGQIEAVLGYQHPRSMGGVAGVCLLLGENLDPSAHLKELGDFYWHLVHPPKGGKPPRRPTEGERDKAYLLDKDFAEGVPYQMTLERTDKDRIRFEMKPLGGEGRTIVLEKGGRSANQLRDDLRLSDGRIVFRFFGVSPPVVKEGKSVALPYELRNVKVTGMIPEPPQQEAGKQ